MLCSIRCRVGSGSASGHTVIMCRGLRTGSRKPDSKSTCWGIQPATCAYLCAISVVELGYVEVAQGAGVAGNSMSSDVNCWRTCGVPWWGKHANPSIIPSDLESLITPRRSTGYTDFPAHKAFQASSYTTIIQFQLLQCSCKSSVIKSILITKDRLMVRENIYILG